MNRPGVVFGRGASILNRPGVVFDRPAAVFSRRAASFDRRAAGFNRPGAVFSRRAAGCGRPERHAERGHRCIVDGIPEGAVLRPRIVVRRADQALRPQAQQDPA